MIPELLTIPKTFRYVKDIDDIRGVALLSWSGDDVKMQLLTPNSAQECMELLFHVWCVGRPLPLRIPDCPYLRERYNSVMVPMEKYRLLKALEESSMSLT